MEIAALLTETFDRIAELVPTTVDGLSDDQLAVRPEGTAGSKGNSIAWLIWHLSRVQDNHLADVAGTEQVWAQGWRERFALPLSDADSIGFGHTSAQVDQVRASAELLAGYHEAVAAATTEFVSELGATDLDRIVDRRFDPPVTLGARLTSVVSDCLQHLGQAAYVRGLLDRATGGGA